MQITKELVTILCPCYNAGKYIHQLLESILKQTYPSIEIIIIDDGSSDDSKDVIERYIPSFFSRGYSLKYLYQKNQGQSVAIKNGLNIVNGEYLTWPDSDDFYSSNMAIELMVKEFQSHPVSVGLVRSKGLYIKDQSNISPIGAIGENALPHIEKMQIFEDCLFARNGFYFAPIGYMTKTQYLKNAIKNDIYTEKDAGQNWQLYLPLLYNYDCVTIPKYLHYVTVRTMSHSRGAYTGYFAILKKLKAYENTLISTLQNIQNFNIKNQEYYIEKVRIKYAKERLKLAFYNDDKNNLKTEYKYLKNINNLNRTNKLRYYISSIGLNKTYLHLESLLKRLKKFIYD